MLIHLVKTTRQLKVILSQNLYKKLNVGIGEAISITAVELYVQSAGVSEEGQIFYTEDDNETEEQIWQRKKESRNHPTNQLSNISFEQFSTHDNGYHKLSTFQKLSTINSVAIEQNIDIIIKQLRLKY